jgi:putative transposase
MQFLSSYPSSLTDEQWSLIEKLLPAFGGFGRPPVHQRRLIVDAILYVVCAGCPWRMLPHDFAPWPTVYGYFRRWRQQGVWQTLHEILVLTLRLDAGKKSNPTAGILDSQSVKIADQAGDRGFDAGKKINGRKRHVLVDTLGLILAVRVTPASVQDRDGARRLLGLLQHRFSRLRLIWADGGYAGQLVEWLWHLRHYRRLRLEVVRRGADQRGFSVLPKRWIVERTFGWLMKYRRLRCDYEQLTVNSETMIYIAMTRLMLRRLYP